MPWRYAGRNTHVLFSAGVQIPRGCFSKAESAAYRVPGLILRVTLGVKKQLRVIFVPPAAIGLSSLAIG
jgi:hypothetical protein